MNHPVNLFVATSVVVLLLHRVVSIVRDSIVEVGSSGPENARPASVVGAALHAAGRIMVLLGTALAISFVIAITEHATHAGGFAAGA